MISNSRKWSDSDIEFLKANYNNMTAREIGECLHYTTTAVYNAAWRHGLKKDKVWNKGMKGVVVPDKCKEHWFRKGMTPWNKGKKGLINSEKCKDTWFKKGNIPHNTKKDGSIVIRRKTNGEQYKYIRISLNKWIPYHRFLWEKYYGEIPKGYIIVFKNKNTMDFRLENLEMISKVEHMRRNTIHRYPEEIKDTIRLVQKLSNTLKKRTNGKNITI